MARNTRRRESAAEPAHIALDHAVRRWEAELENDRKLSHRENGLMAFVAAVLGLGLFKLELFAAPDQSGWMWLVRGLVGISLVLLFAALAKMLLTPEDSLGDEAQLRGPRPPPGLSSGFLRWPEERGPYRMSLADPRAGDRGRARVLVLCMESRKMSQEDPKKLDSDEFEVAWNDLPESIREGFRAEQAMWEEIQAREAEFAKPWGLLGLLGYRTNTGVF